MALPLTHRFLALPLACLSVVSLSSETRGYVLENKSWPDGTVITVQMELGAPSQTLEDGSQTWNEAASPAIDAWNAETPDVKVVAVMDSTKAGSSGDGVNS